MIFARLCAAPAATFVLALGIALALPQGITEAEAQSSETAREELDDDMWDPSWMQRDRWSQQEMSAGMRQRMARHWSFMHNGVPAAYDGQRNPLSPDASTLAEGRALYQANCALCHGPLGMGDGDTARALNPSPALLAYMIQAPMQVDAYMLWAISDGGAAFGTAMPAFKDSLTSDEIWKIITFMRVGFPLDGEDEGD